MCSSSVHRGDLAGQRRGCTLASVEGTPTQCPYCGVGCGLLVDVREGASRRYAAIRSTPSTAAAPAASRWSWASAVHAPDRALRPLVRSDRDARLRAVRWEDALAGVAAGCAPSSPSTAPMRRVLHLRPAADRGLLRGQQARQGLPGHQQRRLQLAPVHVLGRGRLHAARSASTGRRPPTPTSRWPTASCCWGRTPPRAIRSCGRASATARPRARSSSASTRARRRRPRAPTCTCRCGRARTSRCSTRCWKSSTARAWWTRTSSRATRPDGTGARGGPRVVAAARGGGVRRARRGSRRRRVASPAPARAMALWSMGANQSTVGTLKNRALINLCLATGQIGRPGAGPLSLTGQPNAMGGPRDRRPGAPAPGLPPGRSRRGSRRSRRALGRSGGAPVRRAGAAGRRALRRAGGRRGEGGLDHGHQPARLAARRVRARAPRSSAPSSSSSRTPITRPRPRRSPTPSCPPPRGRRRRAR